MMKGCNWKTPILQLFLNLVVFGRQYEVCIKQLLFDPPVLKKHLPFGQVLSLRSHTTLM